MGATIAAPAVHVARLVVVRRELDLEVVQASESGRLEQVMVWTKWRAAVLSGAAGQRWWALELVPRRGRGSLVSAMVKGRDREELARLAVLWLEGGALDVRRAVVARRTSPGKRRAS